MKISKKRGLYNFFWLISGFYTKKCPWNLWSTHYMKTFWNHTYDWLQKRSIFVNKSIDSKKIAIVSSLGIPYMVLRLNVWNKELLTLRNFFWWPKSFWKPYLTVSEYLWTHYIGGHMSSAELAKFEIANTQHKVVNVKFKQELMGYLLHDVATWLVCCRFKSSQYYPICFHLNFLDY